MIHLANEHIMLERKVFKALSQANKNEDYHMMINIDT